LEFIEHEINPLHPISLTWKESKGILQHPEVLRICERVGGGFSDEIFETIDNFIEFL